MQLSASAPTTPAQRVVKRVGTVPTRQRNGQVERERSLAAHRLRQEEQRATGGDAVSSATEGWGSAHAVLAVGRAWWVRVTGGARRRGGAAAQQEEEDERWQEVERCEGERCVAEPATSP